MLRRHQYAFAELYLEIQNKLDLVLSTRIRVMFRLVMRAAVSTALKHADSAE